MADVTNKIYDHSAEHGLISLLLKHPTRIVEAALVLKEDAFALPVTQSMYKLIKYLSGQGQTLDTFRILSEAQKFPQIYRYLGEEQAFTNIEALRAADVDEESFNDFVESIQKHYVARQMIDECGKLKQHVVEQYQQKSTDELLSSAQQFATKLNMDNQIDGNMLAPMGKGLDELMAREVPSDGITGIRTLYPTLDRVTLGLQPKEVYTFAAQSGEGKSTLLKCITNRISVLQGWPSLYLDTEMDRSSQQYRMLAELASVPELDIKTRAYLKDPIAVQRVLQAQQAIDKSKVYHKEITEFSIEQIVNLCRYAVLTYGIKLVAYDYIKIPDSFGGSEQEHVFLGKLTSALKNQIAKDLNVAVITAAQCDQHDARRVADSARIKRFSSFLGYWIPNQSSKGTHRLEIDKNRFGPTGVIYFNFDKPYLRIEEGQNGDAKQLTALPLSEGDASDSSGEDQTTSKHIRSDVQLRSKSKKQQQLSLSNS